MKLPQRHYCQAELTTGKNQGYLCQYRAYHRYKGKWVCRRHLPKAKKESK